MLPTQMHIVQKATVTTTFAIIQFWLETSYSMACEKTDTFDSVKR